MACDKSHLSDLDESSDLGHSEPKHKKAKAKPNGSDTKSNNTLVVLNPADRDLDFEIEENGLKGCALCNEGFAYCWSGARANVGITGGKYCFSCKVISAQPVQMEDTPLDQQNVGRLGISRGDNAVGKLGESVHSFAFGGTGKFSTAGKFSHYGEKFGVGDTILCAVDLERKPLASIAFAKNCKWLGIAAEFNAGSTGLRLVNSPIEGRPWESAIFPHVLLKNVVVQLQFSIEEGLVPEEGYKPWAAALDDGNAVMGPVLPSLDDCEVMMMVGLPASGKSTWAEKWVKEHPEKRYVLLGTNLVLDQMKVPGLQRKHNYGERFERLMGRANAMFDTLLSKAAMTPRNYIIDQTNVYKGARKRKLVPFANFRKVAVVVFPKPEELKFRAHKRAQEMGKEVPADVVNKMLANFALPMTKGMPGSDEVFDEVIFVELCRGESEEHLKEMKCALRTDSSPYSWQSFINPYTSSFLQGPSYSQDNSIGSYESPFMQSQETLPGSGYWPSAAPLAPLNSPPRPLNYTYQTPVQNYEVAEPMSKPNIDGRNRIAVSVATSGSYMGTIEFSQPGTMSSSFMHNSNQAIPEAWRAHNYIPHSAPYEAAWSAVPSSFSIPRHSHESSPAGMQHPVTCNTPQPTFHVGMHPGTYNPSQPSFPAGVQHLGTYNPPQPTFHAGMNPGTYNPTQPRFPAGMQHPGTYNPLSQGPTNS